jgi:hypothetical protein
MAQLQESPSSATKVTDAVHTPLDVLLAPEPTTEELDERRAKLAAEIDAALRRQAPRPRPFSDD